MNSVIIFEVSNGQDRVKEKLKEIGYLTAWTSINEFGQKSRTILPSNSVWKKDTNVKEAFSHIKLVIEQLNRDTFSQTLIELTKCIVLPSAPWAGVNSSID